MPVSATTEPIERSMLPAMITSVTPKAGMAMTALCWIRKSALLTERNRVPPVIPKNTITTISATNGTSRAGISRRFGAARQLEIRAVTA